MSQSSLREAAALSPRAKQFRDSRKMYDSLKDSDFDAVVVSTTEHTHAFAMLPALKRKKHVYRENLNSFPTYFAAIDSRYSVQME